ncbi:unnamed protein product, partial [marine sediment metagenome]
AQGLGACWVGAFEEDKIKDLLKIAKETRPQIIIPIGYADEKPLVPTRYKLDNVAFWNEWWGRAKDINVFLGYTTSSQIRRGIKKGKQALEKARKKIQT